MQDKTRISQSTRVQGVIAPINTVAAFTVRAFCQAHGISKAAFYVYRKQGIGPAIMKVCGRTLISAEAAQAWRKMLTQPTELSGGANV